MFLSYQGLAQLGGQRSFEFLNVPGNARLAGLGGVNVSLNDKDPNFFWSNPALVSDSLSGYASAGYQFFVAEWTSKLTPARAATPPNWRCTPSRLSRAIWLGPPRRDDGTEGRVPRRSLRPTTVPKGCPGIPCRASTAPSRAGQFGRRENGAQRYPDIGMLSIALTGSP